MCLWRATTDRSTHQDVHLQRDADLYEVEGRKFMLKMAQNISNERLAGRSIRGHKSQLLGRMGGAGSLFIVDSWFRHPFNIISLSISVYFSRSKIIWPFWGRERDYKWQSFACG